MHMRFAGLGIGLVDLTLILATSLALADNTVAFSFTPGTQWDVPFPNDIFTQGNAEMVTQRRVNLPLPSDPELVSERLDVESVNVLDGFSIFPRITIPLSGAVPEVDTFTSANVFLVALAPKEQRGMVIPIDQRIIDDSILGAPRLIFAPDEYLQESSRYAIVVTSGLSGGGEAYRGNPAFMQLIDRHRRGVAPFGIYEGILFDALNAIVGGNIAPREALVTLAVFTTRTVRDVPVKLMRRLSDGDFIVTPPRFELDAIPGPEIVPAADVLNIDTFVHRGSVISDGSLHADFPAGTLRIQATDQVVSVDTDDSVYIENPRLAMSIQVPTSGIDIETGALHAVDVSTLMPEPGDELAVLVRKPRLTPINRPLYWGSIGSIVFGSVTAPRYTNASGIIPPVPSGPAGVPQQTGTDNIVFALFLPITPTAPSAASQRAFSPNSLTSAPSEQTEGWPMVHLLHGGAEGNSSFLSAEILNTAPLLASRGLATLAFTAAEFDGGPRSRVHIRTAAGTKSIPQTGRGIDVDGDGLYQQTEIYVYPQRISDLATVIRSLQLGVDLNEDGLADVTRDPAYTHVAGVSFGGATAFIAAALEDRASAFVANTPSSEGSRARNAGFHPIVVLRGRGFADDNLANRIPSLLNGPSPLWGGTFDEAIPLKQQSVQMGLSPGAEGLQRAFDFNMWRDLESMPLAFARHVTSGNLRGGAAPLLLQVARGDGAAVNPIQAMMIRAGDLSASTAVVLLDNEPRFDEQWRPSISPDLARHVLIALPYAPGNSSIEVAGRICHFTRVQIADFLRSGGTMVTDPDEDGTEFDGDVFLFPVTEELLDEMIVNPGVPQSVL
jgi:hypothetical protein